MLYTICIMLTRNLKLMHSFDAILIFRVLIPPVTGFGV